MGPLDHLEIRRDARTPLAVQLSRQLRWLITGGHLVGGERLPSIRELAETTGINLHTVRAAYRHLEDDGLVEVRHGSGAYVLPRDPGRGVGERLTPPSAVYGLIVPTLAGIYRQFVNGAGMAADAIGAIVTVTEARESVTRGTSAAQAMIDMGCAAIVVAAPLIDPERIRTGGERPSRVIVCDWPNGPTPRIDLDLAAGIGEAIEHLRWHGHQRIALVSPPTEWENIRPMHEVFDDLVPDHAHVAVHEFTLEAGAHAAATVLATRPRPTAVIAAGDDVSLGLIAGLGEHGLDVPADLAVVGIGAHAEIGSRRPELTLVEVPARAMGREAVVLASEEPFDPAACRHLAARLTIGASCGCPPSR